MNTCNNNVHDAQLATTNSPKLGGKISSVRIKFSPPFCGAVVHDYVWENRSSDVFKTVI